MIPLNGILTRPGHITLIALHGNGGSHHRFARMRPYLPGTIRFVAPTLPGFGNQPLSNASHTGDYTNFIDEMIQNHPRPRVLLGHGVGGSLALAYAQAHNEELDGLILHTPVGAKLDSRLFPKLMALPGARQLGQRLFAAPPLRPLWSQLLFKQRLPNPFYRHFFDGYAHCSAFSLMFDLLTPAWFATLNPIELPTLLLWGENERLLTPDHISNFQRVCPNNIVELVAGWGHFPMLTRPGHYTHILLKHLPTLSKTKPIPSLLN